MATFVWKLGWYEDDPYGNLGRLQYQDFQAVRLVGDTGIHTKGWTFDQATDFFMGYVGWDINTSQDQIGRYIVIPSQSTGIWLAYSRSLNYENWP